MAMEKKSLVSKKTATPAGKSTKSKIDTSKPAASKVVAAKINPIGFAGNTVAVRRRRWSHATSWTREYWRIGAVGPTCGGPEWVNEYGNPKEDR